jgi:hypothetical protein
MQDTLVEIKIKLPTVELDGLQALADKLQVTPEELLLSFVSDLLASEYSNGEEEHAAAFEWYNRLYANWG